jgi:3-hydroxybutyryl-CoA dehydratase
VNGSPGWRADAANGRLAAGSTVVFRRTFTARDVEEFGRLTRDYNPVHYESRFAALKGFPQVVCHGLLAGAMVCEAGGQWAWLADGMSFRFLRPVLVGDAIECRMTIREMGERGRARAEAELTNQRGETVLRAELTGFLPVGDERMLLGEMLAAGDPTNPLKREPPQG